MSCSISLVPAEGSVASSKTTSLSSNSEICAQAARCYAANFPDAPALGSLFEAAWPACALVCMGFPCQPFSRCMQSAERASHRDRHVCEALPSILDATGARCCPAASCAFEARSGL